MKNSGLVRKSAKQLLPVALIALLAGCANGSFDTAFASDAGEETASQPARPAMMTPARGQHGALGGPGGPMYDRSAGPGGMMPMMSDQMAMMDPEQMGSMMSTRIAKGGEGSPMHDQSAGPGGNMMAMMHEQMAMMDPEVMRSMMSSHMGGSGMMGGRVMPAQHMDEEDVQHHFEHYLNRMDNERLKLGKIDVIDEDTIAADIVTVDDSLVRRHHIDRHSGRITTKN